MDVKGFQDEGLTRSYWPLFSQPSEKQSYVPIETMDQLVSDQLQF